MSSMRYMLHKGAAGLIRSGKNSEDTWEYMDTASQKEFYHYYGNSGFVRASLMLGTCKNVCRSYE